jgi:hypothetical protein
MRRPMDPRPALLLTGVLLAACATYRASPLESHPGGPRLARGPVSAAAMVLVVDDDAKTYLGSDLRKKGIVPVDIWIRNGGKAPIRLRTNNTRLVVQGVGVYDLTSAEEARKKVNKSLLAATGWVALLSGPALPAMIGLSALQIHDVNQRIKRDYELKAFPVDDPIPAGSEVRGVLFFDVPYKPTKKALARDFRVAIVTSDIGRGRLRKFDFGARGF